MKRIGLLLIAILLAGPAVASMTAADAAPPVRQWLEGQLAIQVANEARAVKLQQRQERFVRSTHDVIQERLSALKREVSGGSDEAAVEAVRVALHAHAKAVHVRTQRTMTELLQMLRGQINQTQRMLDEL